MGFLHWLGKRRPDSLADQGQYQEDISRQKPEPKKGTPLPKGVKGHPVGNKPNRRRKD
jgi:hypothetical protein